MATVRQRRSRSLAYIGRIDYKKGERKRMRKELLIGVAITLSLLCVCTYVYTGNEDAPYYIEKCIENNRMRCEDPTQGYDCNLLIEKCIGSCQQGDYGPTSTKCMEIIEKDEGDKVQNRTIYDLALRADSSDHIFTKEEMSLILKMLSSKLPFKTSGMEMTGFKLDGGETVDLTYVQRAHAVYPSNYKDSRVFVTLFIIENGKHNKFFREMDEYLNNYNSLRKGYAKKSEQKLTQLNSIQYNYVDTQANVPVRITLIKNSNLVVYIYDIDEKEEFTSSQELEGIIKYILNTNAEKKQLTVKDAAQAGILLQSYSQAVKEAFATEKACGYITKRTIELAGQSNVQVYSGYIWTTLGEHLTPVIKLEDGTYYGFEQQCTYQITSEMVGAYNGRVLGQWGYQEISEAKRLELNKPKGTVYVPDKIIEAAPKAEIYLHSAYIRDLTCKTPIPWWAESFFKSAEASYVG